MFIAKTFNVFSRKWGKSGATWRQVSSLPSSHGSAPGGSHSNILMHFEESMCHGTKPLNLCKAFHLKQALPRLQPKLSFTPSLKDYFLHLCSPVFADNPIFPSLQPDNSFGLELLGVKWLAFVYSAKCWPCINTGAASGTIYRLLGQQQPDQVAATIMQSPRQNCRTGATVTSSDAADNFCAGVGGVYERNTGA